MSDDVVLVEVSDRVAVVTLNRPEARNALNGAVRRRLPAVMIELEARDDVDVVILTGTDPAFCAGVDLKELGGGVLSDATEYGPVDMGARGGDGRLPYRGALPPRTKPLIGAINGVAITGGFEIALCCDFLVASERARFADTHARVGVMPGWGLTVMLVQSVGVRKAREMSVTGNFLSAEEALQFGLVNHVVPHDELLPFTRRLAHDVTTIDQRAVRRMLATYDEITATTVDAAWEIEAEVSRLWEAGGVDTDAIEARRRAIVERGRAQL